MRRAYIALLRLYPAEHRAVFAAEMLDTFDHAASNWRARGMLAFCCFTTWELTGLLHGLLGEWIAKRTAGEEYLRSCSQFEEECKQPKNFVLLFPRPGQSAAELERLLRRLVRSMEFAIAHHDFPKARFYSTAEEVTRKRLERLLQEG